MYWKSDSRHKESHCQYFQCDITSGFKACSKTDTDCKTPVSSGLGDKRSSSWTKASNKENRLPLDYYWNILIKAESSYGLFFYREIIFRSVLCTILSHLTHIWKMTDFCRAATKPLCLYKQINRTKSCSVYKDIKERNTTFLSVNTLHNLYATSPIHADDMLTASQRGNVKSKRICWKKHFVPLLIAILSSTETFNKQFISRLQPVIIFIIH